MSVPGEAIESGVTSESPFRFTTATMLVAIFFASFILAGYARGNYLFGLRGAIIYTVVASLITLLYVRALTRVPLSRAWLVALTLFAVPVSLAFAFPAYLNPNVEFGIRDQKVDRLARAELSVVFADDPAFRELRVTTTHLKIVNVEIHGSVPTKEDLDRLRTRVMEQCEFPKQCVVHWRIDVRDSATPYTGWGTGVLDPGPR